MKCYPVYSFQLRVIVLAVMLVLSTVGNSMALWSVIYSRLCIMYSLQCTLSQEFCVKNKNTQNTVYFLSNCFLKYYNIQRTIKVYTVTFLPSHSVLPALYFTRHSVFSLCDLTDFMGIVYLVSQFTWWRKFTHIILTCEFPIYFSCGRNFTLITCSGEILSIKKTTYFSCVFHL